jgi:competence ComEA-like helix-hairpin-helix protein
MANADSDKQKTNQSRTTDNPTGQDVAAATAQLDINRASEADLAEIDMIGKKLAKAIVEQREGGSFQSWDDLKRVPGMDATKLAELQRAARLRTQS